MKRYAIIMKYDQDPINPREYDNLGTMVCWHPRYNLGDKQIECPDDWYEWLSSTFDIPNLSQFEYRYGELEQYPTEAEQKQFNELAARVDKEDLNDDEQEEYEYLYELCENYEPNVKLFRAIIDGWVEDNLAHRNLYLYDHSGITMNTTGFSCGWDSGMVGMIYCTREKAEREGIDFDKVGDILVSEVKEYDKYLTGECYGLVVYELPDDFDISTSYAVYDDTYVLEEHTGIAEEIEREFEEVSSCWGFLGYEYAKEEAKDYVKNYI